MNDQTRPEGPFKISFDLYENGKETNLLVLPCNETYIVVKNDEHLCTIVKTFDQPDYWELQEGNLKEEVVEKMGAAISKYGSSV
ncbi:hypothetical protein [Mucilaginibacter agri]|uniref:Uncharacterized protein n=1 Tax=Mucilaginibacter agri TaxID=2695265 RepID=A0A965ZHI8_9SPHI|nr:hypothetical protein [Mucilaginibacter agri]NCD71194.1 hypothetical protein [Mucilaginibacter agri]